jgi:hypothetical protein
VEKLKPHFSSVKRNASMNQEEQYANASECHFLPSVVAFAPHGNKRGLHKSLLHNAWASRLKRSPNGREMSICRASRGSPI